MLGLGITSCGHLYKSGEGQYRGQGYVLVCPDPKELKPLPGNDPASAIINAKQVELYDQERTYFQDCVKALTYNQPIPERPAKIKIDEKEIREAQREWIKEQARIAEARAQEERAKTAESLKEVMSRDEG